MGPEAVPKGSLLHFGNVQVQGIAVTRAVVVTRQVEENGASRMYTLLLSCGADQFAASAPGPTQKDQGNPLKRAPHFSDLAFSPLYLLCTLTGVLQVHGAWGCRNERGVEQIC